mmetsp:Transcript_34245/g.91414  ORF Transcript_34245/g.91414 Transcript_34245/m.91414 type:complete len:262 (-) Transcript_34245:1560-2345(-)
MQPAATSSLMVCRPDLDFITELVKLVMMTKRSSVASDSRWGGGKTARGSSRNTDSFQYVLKTLVHNCANARASGPVAVRNVIMCRWNWSSPSRSSTISPLEPGRHRRAGNTDAAWVLVPKCPSTRSHTLSYTPKLFRSTALRREGRPVQRESTSAGDINARTIWRSVTCDREDERSCAIFDSEERRKPRFAMAPPPPLFRLLPSLRTVWKNFIRASRLAMIDRKPSCKISRSSRHFRASSAHRASTMRQGNRLAMPGISLT